MALLRAVAGLGELEDNGNQDGECAHIFEDCEKAPTAEGKCGPFEQPFRCDEWNQPAGRAMCSFRPGRRSISCRVQDHVVFHRKLYIISLQPAYPLNLFRLFARLPKGGGKLVVGFSAKTESCRAKSAGQLVAFLTLIGLS